MRFNTLPYTYREGFVLSNVEVLRSLVTDKYDWFYVLMSPSLFTQLEKEEMGRFTYWELNDGTMLVFRTSKIVVLMDVENRNKLPPNSIIEINKEYINF